MYHTLLFPPLKLILVFSSTYPQMETAKGTRWIAYIISFLFCCRIRHPVLTSCAYVLHKALWKVLVGK